MFSLFSRRVKSISVTKKSIQLEPLEGRRMLSVSSIADDVLQITSDDQFKTEAVIVPATAKIVKIEGTYVGHYDGKKLGKHTLQFDITHFTHTGHFKGNVFIGTTSGGTTAAAITSGVVHSNRHVDITYANNAFNGTFVGIASHTGGSFNGHFTVTGAVKDSGTFNVGKS
jgi:hypothetical protein